ncbi:Conjugal transfer protein trbF [Granulibacter bethesdensis]|uniref:VirB8/TrbF family protein n=1 Tax=Granulibacter bethesdensis TaxID=364410 RepID=UPI00090CD2AA|nr:VirB8/TrbF family protein [Granulibacter bethesdensis]APH57195.1 Conjugal transfer protein trbF [Granulibacter bethesdensis]
MKRQVPDKKKTVNAPLSPYIAARREWNERYGEYIKKAKTWRLTAFFALGIAFVAVGGLVSVSMQSRVVPYIVSLNGHNDVVRVERAEILKQPDSNVIAAALANWVIGARTIYTDGQAMKNLIDTTYAMTLPQSAAYQALASYHREHNPYILSSSENISVQINLVVPVSNESWEVEWTETTKSPSGKVISTKDWKATLTISLAPPTDPQQIMLNPLGIYVRQFAWSSRLPS